MNIDEVLYSLGFSNGWAADHSKGIILWLREEPQPTEETLIAAGWEKQPEENN